MKSLYEGSKQGLQEAIDYEKGDGNAKAATYVIEPVRRYDNKEIRAIRNNDHMTQTVFADYMGVRQDSPFCTCLPACVSFGFRGSFGVIIHLSAKKRIGIL